MKRLTRIKKFITLGLGVSALALGTSTANAAEYWLCAGSMDKTMSDGAIVTMWGYAEDDNANLLDGCGTGAVQIPGPPLVVPAGDLSGLTVHLRNDLNVATSLIIPSQRLPTSNGTAAAGPTFNGNRVQSLIHETPAAGGIADYVWATPKPGSHIYHSATHQQAQVQMGLYGPMMHDSAVGAAYPGALYSSEVIIFYSEIDPVLHDAIATGCFGSNPVAGCPVPNISSTLNYKPKYSLVNGAASDGSVSVLAGQTAQNILLRFFNAGFKSHVPQSLGLYMSLLAENGYRFSTPKTQYTVELHAMGTVDAIINSATAGIYTIFDRRLNLSDGTTAGLNGMISRLEIGGIGGPQAVANSFVTDEDTPVTVNMCANDLPVGDIDFASAVVTLATNGIISAPTIIGSCDYVYTPNPDFNGSDQFTYTVRSLSTGAISNSAVVSITVNPINDNPVATPDTLNVVIGTTSVVIPAADVVGNDTDADVGAVLTLVDEALQTTTFGTALISANTITYTPNVGVGAPIIGSTDVFSYTVTDGVVGSVAATTTVTVTYIGAPAPVAVNDPAITTAEDTAISINVLINDSSDPTTSLDPSTVTFTVPSSGTTQADLVNIGNVIFTPALDSNGLVTFTYTVNDLLGSVSNSAIVTIDVTPVNDTPVAVDDTTFTATEGGALTIIPAPGVLANDTDADVGDILVANIDSTVGTTGTVVLNVSGAIDYTSAVGLPVGTTDSFTYTVTDGIATSLPATVTITLVAGVAGPFADDDVAATNEDTQVTIDVLTGDTVPAPAAIDPTTVTILTTSPGTVVSADPVTGLVSYTPAPNFFGSDTFTYQVSDDQARVSNFATVTVTVASVNDAPQAGTDNYAIVAGSPATLLTPNVLANDFDVDSTAISVTGVDLTGTVGTVSLPPSGDLTYTPAANAVAGDVDTFTYMAIDNEIPPLSSAPTTVTITIGNGTANQAPKPEADEIPFSADGGTGLVMTITATQLLQNDADPDGNLANGSVDLFSTVTRNGSTVTKNPDGTLSYTAPAPGTFEDDEFDYWAVDDLGLRSTGTATVKILLQ